jgi:6-phosphogluconolactonase
VGHDGHTASLFPGTTALSEVTVPAVSCFVPQLSTWRVTLTLPVFDNARDVVFLAAGEAKAPVIAKIVASGGPRTELPASLIRPTQGTVEWMLDAAAGSLLPPEVMSKRSSPDL